MGNNCCQKRPEYKGDNLNPYGVDGDSTGDLDNYRLNNVKSQAEMLEELQLMWARK